MHKIFQAVHKIIWKEAKKLLVFSFAEHDGAHFATYDTSHRNNGICLVQIKVFHYNIKVVKTLLSKR